MSRITAVTAVFLLMILCTACKGKDNYGEKVRDLDFTVVENAEVPEELMEILEQQKKDAFRLTYGTEDYLYICVGYGAMETGGYSISVDELYLTDKVIYLDTNLIGPKKGETVTDSGTTPFIVIKTEYYDNTVVFN